MCNRVNPDFDKWAAHILDRSELAQALKQAFEQGWSAGYMDGQEQGWQKEWDGHYTTGVIDLGNKEKEEGC